MIDCVVLYLVPLQDLLMMQSGGVRYHGSSQVPNFSCTRHFGEKVSDANPLWQQTLVLGVDLAVVVVVESPLAL